MITVKSAVRSSGKYLGALLGVSATAAVMGYLTVYLVLATTVHSQNSPTASVLSNGANTTFERGATVDIVPAPMIKPSFGHFIGTGDGSEGSWSRP
ncbi:MAG: hypothetical protein JOY71_05375 [Acetobacteraceae bacterium]|nr:hypothetical protein [Acetobacteraceae bacterium]